MYELVAPALSYRDSFLSAVAEGGEGILTGRWCARGDQLASPGVLEELIAQLNAEEHDPPPGWVPALHRWIVDGPDYLGRITLRAGLTPPLEQAIGQIGYAVRPSARGRGAATWALGTMLGVAAGRGMDRILITCDDDNSISAAVIEHHGGVLEDRRRLPGGPLRRRYWIDLRPSA